MADTSNNTLKVSLALSWAHDNIYDANVSVTVPDSCYIEGDLKVGLPPGMVGIPEIQYLTFSFTHKSGPCSEIIRTVKKSAQVQISLAKRSVTAFAAVDGKERGHDTKSIPRAE